MILFFRPLLYFMGRVVLIWTVLVSFLLAQAAPLPTLSETLDEPEVRAKLPSIAGSTDRQLWLLDARGERLTQISNSDAKITKVTTPFQPIDLWRPNDSSYAYVSDLLIQNGWIYFLATFEDVIYKTPIAALQRLKGQTNRAIKLMRVTATDPLLKDLQQHFLYSGLWLVGKTRKELLARAKALASSGWPVSDGQRTLGKISYDSKAASQGQLCVNYTAKVPVNATSNLCVSLPAGWQVGAIYPLGLRSISQPAACGNQALDSAAQWLWLEVDLVGESEYSIESRTLLMRVAVVRGQLKCWDTVGHQVDAKTRASLMRVFALVGRVPTAASTLLPDIELKWTPQTVTMDSDFWPAPLSPSFAIGPSQTLSGSKVLTRALPYAQQSWKLPHDSEAKLRYSQWQKEGFFARCFPESEVCAKPLGPRYLSQALVQKNYVGLPYGWGSNDTPETFQKRIIEGAYPGDINTNNEISNAVAGVDCSGFISNVWQLPQRVVTTCRDGPDPWTPKPGDTSCVGSFSNRVNWLTGQSGDALLMPGHVRLVANLMEPKLAQAGRGLFVEIVESSGFCAGACHRLMPAREAGRYRMMRPRLTE